MNSNSTALLTIIAKCNPTDKELQRESLIQNIMHTNEYVELSVRRAFAPYFESLFTEGKLRSYTDKELYAAKKAIPLIPDAIENIVFSIKNGVGPSLTAEDKPDFINADSLKAIIAKTTDSDNSKNYTNIEPNQFMDIFSGDTVKNANGVFGKLTMDCSDYGTELAKLLADKTYCISENEIVHKEQEYKAKLDGLNDEIQRSAARRKRRRFIKAEVGTIALFVPTIVAGLSGSISPAVVGGCTLAELILTIIFWIGG